MCRIVNWGKLFKDYNIKSVFFEIVDENTINSSVVFLNFNKEEFCLTKNNKQEGIKELLLNIILNWDL